MVLASVVIRTLNEEKYLDELLSSVFAQSCGSINLEVIIVDSGSTDRTLDIASKHPCRITHIKKEEFTFGRSLNIGCRFADGDFLVFISGHCIPTNSQWLDELIKPLQEGTASYSYGRQVGKGATKFSELQHFEKCFPAYSKIPQEGFFCNNANAAISRSVWETFEFDEELTGLEDMHLAKEIVKNGHKIAYTSTASVYHIHDETWSQVKKRYEREAYALQRIMPEIHFTLGDFFRFLLSGVLSDSAVALKERTFFKKIYEIFMFRLMHYWGAYKGNHQVRQLSEKMKHYYFYPKDIEKPIYEEKAGSSVADESQQ